MQQAHYIICDNGDGSQSVEWYKGSEFTIDQLYEAANTCQWNSYQSGDGVQLTTLEFPDYFELNEIKGITWCDVLPGTDKY